jgi:hypothetical protein
MHVYWEQEEQYDEKTGGETPCDTVPLTSEIICFSPIFRYTKYKNIPYGKTCLFCLKYVHIITDAESPAQSELV